MAKKKKTEERITENIKTIDYESEMQQSYIDYAMSVIMGRALPDIRDGHKPVQRRILYSMDGLNLDPNKPYKKSARIVGDTLGKFHPHGDSSVYEAMARMAQDFSLKIPLVDGHGNFGSIDGDEPASMRYTEARLSPIAMEMLDDLEKNVVDFKPNFDESLKEPTVLPSKFPNLLVNGANGIAVGMATNIPTHNLKEVIDAVIAYIDDESITVKDLLKYVKGPDFSTGGIITNKKDLKNIYETGRGKITIRSKIDVENAGNGRYNIVITEIPYTYSGNKERLIDSIIDKANKKQLNEITDIRDESSDSIRIVIETKRGTDIEKFKHKLFKRTPLEDNYNVTFLALIDKQPVLFNLKTYVEEFVKFQREIYTRKYEYLLGKAETREEVLAGLIKAYDEIDLIIETIRGSKSTKDVKNCLVNGDTTNIKFKTNKSENLAKKFKYTEAQANAILDMKLQKLIALEKDLLEKEYKELLTTIKSYKKILTDSKTLNNVIKATLLEISKKYGTARKTQVKNLDTIDVEDEFVEEDLYILLDKFGYIKAIDENSYNRTENFDSYKLVLKSKNTDKLFFFTKKGMLHQIDVLDIPKTRLKEKGESIYNIFNLKDDEIIKTMIYPPEVSTLLFITKLGYSKIVDISEFESNRKTIIGTKLREKDELLNVFEFNDEENLVLFTKNGYLLKFKTEEISRMKRNAVGVSSIKLKDDFIIDARIFTDNSDLEVKYQDGKKEERIMLRSVRSQKRNTKGRQIATNNFKIIK